MQTIRNVLAHPILGSTVGTWIGFLIIVGFFVWLGMAAWDQPSWHCRYVDYEWFCP